MNGEKHLTMIAFQKNQHRASPCGPTAWDAGVLNWSAGMIPAALLPTQLSSAAPRKAVVHVLVCLSPMGDQEEFPGSWLQPGPFLAIWERQTNGQKVSLSVCFSSKQCNPFKNINQCDQNKNRPMSHQGM